MQDVRLQNILSMMQELLPILLNEDEPEGGSDAGGLEALMGESDTDTDTDIEGLPGKAISIEVAEPIDDDFETDAAIDEADPDLDDEEDKEIYRSMLRDLK